MTYSARCRFCPHVETAKRKKMEGAINAVVYKLRNHTYWTHRREHKQIRRHLMQVARWARSEP